MKLGARISVGVFLLSVSLSSVQAFLSVQPFNLQCAFPSKTRQYLVQPKGAIDNDVNLPSSVIYYGWEVSFDARRGTVIPVPEYDLPTAFAEWGVEIPGYEIALQEVTLKNDLISRKSVRYLPESACGADNVPQIISTKNYKAIDQPTKVSESSIFFYDPERKMPSLLVVVLGNMLHIEVIFIDPNHDFINKEAGYRLRLMIKYDMKQEKWTHLPVQITIERSVEEKIEGNDNTTKKILPDKINLNEAVDALTITERIGTKKCYALQGEVAECLAEDSKNIVSYKGSGLRLKVDVTKQNELIMQWDNTILQSIYHQYKFHTEKLNNISDTQITKWKLNMAKLSEIISKVETLPDGSKVDVKTILNTVN